MHLETFDLYVGGLWLALTAIVVLSLRFLPRQRTGIRVFLLAIAISTLTLPLGIALRFIPEDRVALAAPYFVFGLVLAIYLLIRSRKLPRPRLFPLLHETRQALTLLAKSLLVLYFILLLGQLPFRYHTTHVLQQIAENEVQYILTHGK